MSTPTPALCARVAIVTGASAGIGEAIARELAASGARVVINARRAERLAEVAATLARQFGADRVTTAPGDAADPRVIDALFAKAREAFSAPADLIVANAGRGLKGSPVDSDPAQWDEMIRTNLTGVAHLLRAAASHLLSIGGPDAPPASSTSSSPTTPTTPPTPTNPRDIIVIGSVVGRHVSPFSSMYGSTKFAVHGLTEGVRRQLGPQGIRVSLVEPGFVTSEFQGVAGYDPKWYDGVVGKIGPVLDPADVARVVAFIAQQPAHVHVGDVLVRPVRQEYP
jgi:NADP-dependent 3-hydroxy acid dehydrogenase YdfG